MAKVTSDPALAARLIERAADIKEQADELTPSVSPIAPDVQKQN